MGDGLRGRYVSAVDNLPMAKADKVTGREGAAARLGRDLVSHVGVAVNGLKVNSFSNDFDVDQKSRRLFLPEWSYTL